jgi:hypothetical protein
MTNNSQTHVLLKDTSENATNIDAAESIGLVAPKTLRLEFDEDDVELAPLLSQLQSHLDSIKANTEPLADVDAEMLKTRAAMNAVLADQVT